MMKKYLLSLTLLLVSTMICSAVFAETFTIAVIPDTQNYCRSTYSQPASTQIFKDEMQFIVDSIDSMNTVFITHVGDMVNDSDQLEQWPRAVSAMNILQNTIPMGMVPGNHDYDDNDAPIYRLELWTGYFGAASEHFFGKGWYGGAYMNSTDTSGGSSYQTFKAGGQDFLHISLEMEASDDVLAWAQSVMDMYAGWPTIISVHKFLNVTTGDRASVSYRTGSPSNSAQEIWDELITINPQIFMVLCGHSFDGEVGCSYNRSDLNDDGRIVHQIVTDYQGVKSDTGGTLGKGGGWVRFMEFDTDLKTIRVETYSTILDKYSSDPSLTDGSSYAKTWAPFNYYNGTGSLIPESDPRCSSFTLPLDITTYGSHIQGLSKSFQISGSGGWVVAGLAFDPTYKVGGKYDRIYYCNRVDSGNQGLYAASISEKISSERLALSSITNPYGCTVDQSGHAYVCYAVSAQVWKVTNPSDTALETQLIGTYSGSDDDPVCISMVPEGFGGGFDAGVDLIIHDGGIGSDGYEGVVVIQSNSSASNPLYNIIWKDNSGYFPGDQRGCASDIDGYYYLVGMTIPKADMGGTQTCYINRVKADGVMQRIFLDLDVTEGGTRPSLDDSATVNPVDGSVWFVTADTANDGPRNIWRVDVADATAIGGGDYLAETTAEIVDFYNNVGVNDLAFPPDGRHLAVGCPSGDDRIYIFNALPPADCDDAIEKGYSLVQDLNNDCKVNFEDFAIFSLGWLDNIDPQDANSSSPWD
ncbi:MAG: metallophosphoesterase [Sedimentisphaerales bacterium]|nr:metallophosphoesterase [Sedimentisphaerales bacterium]